MKKLEHLYTAIMALCFISAVTRYITYLMFLLVKFETNLEIYIEVFYGRCLIHSCRYLKNQVN